MSEEWRSVLGFEGLYEVSNLGRIKSKIRTNVKILTPEVTRKGYLRVSITKNGKAIRKLIHNIVAESFIGTKVGVVNHKDLNKSNNISEPTKHPMRLAKPTKRAFQTLVNG